MSLRALSSLLIRRFSPRRIPAAQAETIGLGLASGRPTRSLHTLSNPDAAVGALGALSAAGLASLVGFLYLKNEDKVGEVTHEGASNVVRIDMGTALNDPAIIAMFTDKDGNISWMEYNDYLVFRMDYLDRKLHATNKEARREVPVKRVGNVMKLDEAVMKKMFEETMKKYDEEYKNHMKMVMEQEYKVDEAVLKKRFEDWMKEYGRTYKDEKEKARRYEVFKANAIKTDKLNTHSLGAHFGTTNFADWTKDERMSINSRHGDIDWKSHFEEMKTMYAEGRFDAHRRIVAPDELDCTDAVKKRFRELVARKAEQERQANKN